MPEGDVATAASRAEHGLGMLPPNTAGRGIPRVTDGHMASESRQGGLVKNLRYQAEVFKDQNLLSVPNANPRCFLPPVLQSIQTVVGELRCLLPRRVHSEHATFFVRLGFTTIVEVDWCESSTRYTGISLPGPGRERLARGGGIGLYTPRINTISARHAPHCNNNCWFSQLNPDDAERRKGARVAPRWGASAIRLRRPLPDLRQPARHLCRARTRELYLGAAVLPLNDPQREPNPREAIGFHHIRRGSPGVTWAFDALHRRKRRNANFHAMPGGVGF